MKKVRIKFATLNAHDRCFKVARVLSKVLRSPVDVTATWFLGLPEAYLTIQVEDCVEIIDDEGGEDDSK